MAIAVGASTSGSGSVSSATALASSSITSQASGSTFILGVNVAYSGAVFTPQTDSKGNTYTLLGTQQNNASDTYSTAWYICVNGTGGASHTASFKTNLSSSGFIHFIEITGGQTSGIVDQTSGAAATGSPYSSPVTTTSPNELVLQFVDYNNVTTATINGGFSSVTTQTQNIICKRNVTSTGTYDAVTTGSGTSRANVLTASFIELVAAPSQGEVLTSQTFMSMNRGFR